MYFEFFPPLKNIMIEMAIRKKVISLRCFSLFFSPFIFWKLQKEIKNLKLVTSQGKKTNIRFFFSEPCLTPPPLLGPSEYGQSIPFQSIEVCFFHTYVFSYFFLSKTTTRNWKLPVTITIKIQNNIGCFQPIGNNFENKFQSYLYGRNFVCEESRDTIFELV